MYYFTCEIMCGIRIVHMFEEVSFPDSSGANYDSLLWN
jgi:hypothetical protein